MFDPGDTVYTLTASRDGVAVRRGIVRFVDRREGLDDNGHRYERTTYGVRFDGAEAGDAPYPIDAEALLDVGPYGVMSATALGNAVMNALDDLAEKAELVKEVPTPRETTLDDPPPPPPGFDASDSEDTPF